jgi:hypothetical protein
METYQVTVPLLPEVRGENRDGQHGHKEISMIEIFVTVIVMEVSQVCMYFQTHNIVQIPLHMDYLLLITATKCSPLECEK